MAEQKLVEILNLSDYDGGYKGVQLYADKSPVLILGPETISWHYKLLRTFLEERGLKFSTIQPPGTRTPLQVPALEGERYRVVGMGTFHFNPIKKWYSGAGGASQDYKTGIDEEHRTLVKKTLEASGWKIL
ncbi:MAG: hypothetical protein V1866_01670 [archaeon]